MPEIKACPFCGSKDDPNTQQLGPSLFTENSRSFVGCVECGARGPMVEDDDYTRDEYVIEQWNNRIS